jgi:hypothetical protein
MNGQLIETNPEVELGDYDKCSDMNVDVNLNDMFPDGMGPEEGFEDWGTKVECEEN